MTAAASMNFHGGFNWRAIGALVAGIVVALAGLEIKALRGLYHYAWFVGLVFRFVVYLAFDASSSASARVRDQIFGLGFISRNFRICRSTPSSIAGVNLPVNVFCWLG